VSDAFRTVRACRVCGGSNLEVFLSLGETPLANSFVQPSRATDAEDRYPLAVARCGECGLVQLTVVVDPEIMFRDYLYESSASTPLLTHFDVLAEVVARDFVAPGALVVEFGSNDGLLLRSLKRRGLRSLGVEPARNLAQRANAEGLETLSEFFAPDTAAQIRRSHGPAAAVIGNNVLAHIDDLAGVTSALDLLLAPDGVFIAEVPYLVDLLARVEYDTIYHEHLSYFHLTPLRRLFDAAGLELFDVVPLPIHGGSIRIHVARRGRRAQSRTLLEMLAAEERAGLRGAAPFHGFAASVKAHRAALVDLLGMMKKDGKHLAGYGATAKGNTMLNYCDIDARTLDFIADTTSYKQGLLTPGTHIPVVPESAIAERRPDALLLLAWNYADSIVARHSQFLSRGGRFIHPIPMPRVISA
jgi:novobiocin biosynthesis protein NovU/D-mycarose 3-C-methyltransferase